MCFVVSMSVQISERLYGRISVTYLVICDGINQVLDKAAQGVSVVSVLEELRNPVLSGKWFELCKNLG